MESSTLQAPIPTKPRASYGILGAISASHLINDMMQSILLALYPILQGNFQLSFVQIGFITVAFQFSASLLQPIVGHYTDKHPKPFSLPIGMGFTLLGLILLSVAWSYPVVLVAAILVGMGSSVFHPESSRIARMASAGQHGKAQSIFQVGGTMGSAIGPLVAAVIIVPYGQKNVAWIAVLAFIGMTILFQVGRWYAKNLQSRAGKKSLAPQDNGLNKKQVKITLSLLLLLIFSKFAYTASINSYLTFYLIDHFGVSIQQAQYFLFIFLFGAALGTLVGGPIGDRIGRRRIIIGSIVGSAPFALLLPFANLQMTIILAFTVGFILSSAFPAIVVYGQELIPGKTGTISGMFFGFGFGIAGIAAAALGALADVYSIELVYHLCAFLPLLGVVAFFLPELKQKQ